MNKDDENILFCTDQIRQWQLQNKHPLLGSFIDTIGNSSSSASHEHTVFLYTSRACVCNALTRLERIGLTKDPHVLADIHRDWSSSSPSPSHQHQQLPRLSHAEMREIIYQCDCLVELVRFREAVRHTNPYLFHNWLFCVQQWVNIVQFADRIISNVTPVTTPIHHHDGVCRFGGGDSPVPMSPFRRPMSPPTESYENRTNIHFTGGDIINIPGLKGVYCKRDFDFVRLVLSPLAEEELMSNGVLFGAVQSIMASPTFRPATLEMIEQSKGMLLIETKRIRDQLAQFCAEQEEDTNQFPPPSPVHFQLQDAPRGRNKSD